MFFEFNQNNSGGDFIVDDKVCCRLFIEADSHERAKRKAEELGCYWDGVAEGIDCSCCGDRWSYYDDDPVNLEKFKTDGYKVTEYGNTRDSAIKAWKKKYSTYQVVDEPIVEEGFLWPSAIGHVRFKDIEQYAQYLADNYGWTIPDVRIYYSDGRVKEIYSSKFTQ